MSGEFYYTNDFGDKIPMKNDWRDKTWNEEITLRFIPNPMHQRNPLERPNNIWIQTPFGSILATDFPPIGKRSPTAVMYRMRDIHQQNQFDFNKFVEIVQFFSTKD